MAISTGSGKGSVTAEINVTPMIDVMLVLLIIFMIVTPVLESGFQAQMPAGLNVDQRPEGDDEITLGLDVNGAYFLNGDPVSKEQAEAKLTELYAARTLDKIIFFKADGGLKFGVIEEAVTMASRAGARVLVSITDRKGGLMAEEK